MELHNYRYVRRNGSIDEFIEKEARHRGMDKRQAPFRSTVEERCEPYKEAKDQPPSYRRIEMNNTTFASAEPELETPSLGANLTLSSRPYHV